MTVTPLTSLDVAAYRESVRRALAEDVRCGDVTTEVAMTFELTRATG